MPQRFLSNLGEVSEENDTSYNYEIGFLDFITNINIFPLSFDVTKKMQPTYLQRKTFWRSFSFFTSSMDYAVLAINLVNESWAEITKFCSSQQYLSSYSMRLHQFGCIGALWKETS